MAENSSTEASGLNHDAGSLTHNNASDLPGQVPGTARSEQSPDHAPDVAQSFDEQAQTRQPVSLDRDEFYEARGAHMPTAQLDMHADLPNTDSVDRAKFNYLQNQEDWNATKGQRTMTEHEYQNPPPKADPMPQQDFEKVRAKTQPDQTRHVQSGHTR